MNVTIVDYNSGNISSVINSFKEAAKDKVNIDVTSNLNKIKSSDKIVLPGQGSFKSCIDALNNISGLVDTLNEFLITNKKPILGICVGHQYMVTHFGGKAGPASIPEFGSSLVTLIERGWILKDFPDEFNVWESHNDEVYKIPDGFKLMASSEACEVQVIEHDNLPYAGVQYHPEVEHTEYGSELCQNFLKKALEWNE